MKKLIVIAGIAAMVLAVAAWAQEQAPATPGAGQCPMAQGGGHMMGGRGMMMGGRGMMAGTVEVNRESKAVWDRITRLQTQMRNKQWELFALKSQGAGEEQLQAKLAELQGLGEQMRAAHEQFRQFVTVPEGMGAGQGRGMRGQGMHGEGTQGGGMHRRGLQGGRQGTCPFHQQAAPKGDA